MITPNFSKYQFLDQNVLNTAFAGPYESLLIQNTAFTFPGGVNWNELSATPSLLVVSVSLPAPFGIQFSSGVYAQAHGVINGVDSSTYSLNFSSFVPGSGSSTVYAVASAAQVGENPLQVVGPPPGHPDYDPTFTPTTDYTTTYDTLDVYVTTTVPNNTSVIELFRTVLTAGQTSIASGNIDYSHQVTAYVSSPVVSVFERQGNVVAEVGDYSTWYGQLAAANIWLGNNTFATTSGGAANSPFLILQGWTGSAGIKTYIFDDSSGVLHIRENTNASDIFTVDQSGNTRAYGAFTANGNATLLGTLSVTNNTALGGALGVTNGTTLASTLGVSGAVVLGSTLSVLGTSSYSQYAQFLGAVYATTTLAVTGATTLNSTLGVTGVATLNSTLSVAGAGSFAETLGVSGNVTIGGSITSTGVGNFNTSAREFKENIRAIEHSAEKFMQLRPNAYTHLPSHLPTVGFMADDIYEIYPELVQLKGGKPYALNYQGLIPYSIAMIQEQEARIRKLEARLGN